MKKNKLSKSIQMSYFNKVKNYISMEYSEEIVDKICEPKYKDIIFSYVKNCLSLNRTIPFTANEVVRFITKTK